MLDVMQAYDFGSRSLYSGSVPRLADFNTPYVINTAAGIGSQGFNGEALPATASQLGGNLEVAVLRGYELFIADNENQRIRKLELNGTLRTVVSGTSGTLKLAAGPDGFLYAADSSQRVIRRYVQDVTGTYVAQTVAGSGAAGTGGDGGPAVLAQLGNNLDVMLGFSWFSQARIVILDNQNQRLRVVGADRRIGFFSSGNFGSLGGFDALGNGFGYQWSPALISGVKSSTGQFFSLAGTGVPGFSGDDGYAPAAQVGAFGEIAMSPSREVFINDAANKRVRLVSGRLIKTIAGTGSAGFSGDGGPAEAAMLNSNGGIALASNGAVYIADDGNFRVRKLSPAWNGFTAQQFYAPAADGSEVYGFSSNGRHVSTRHGLTGGLLYSFQYDTAGRISSIVDGDGNTTTIERLPSGAPSAIVGPYGQRTTLGVNAGGLLSSVTNPAGEEWQLGYTTGDVFGLLSGLRTPRGHNYTFTYDADGNLHVDSDPAGGSQTLVKTKSTSSTGTGVTRIVRRAFEVVRTTFLGRETRYKQQEGVSGPLVRTNLRYLRTITNPDGTLRRIWVRTNGVEERAEPDGTVTVSNTTGDPRFERQVRYPSRTQISTPGGRVQTTTESRTATLFEESDPLSVDSTTELRTVNGRPYSSVYNGFTRMQTMTSPEGRVTTRRFDILGRIREAAVTGLSPVRFEYDARGRLARTRQGTGAEERVTEMSYHPGGTGAGWLASVTDPLGRSMGFEYDLAGRTSKQTLPDLREIRLSYDATGNLASVTPPGRPAHTFSYSPVDLEEAYAPPDVGLPNEATDYDYNPDRQSTTVTRPDGLTITYGYDSAGRLSTITAPHGVTTYTYDSAGRVQTVTAPGPAPGGEVLTYAYDGSLLTGTTMSGSVNGSVTRTYDNDLRLASMTVTDGVTSDTVSFTYDNDGLLVQAGAMAISRNPMNGVVAATTLGNVSDTWTYNDFGEPIHYTARFNSTVLYELDLERDKLGRIAQKVETIEGHTDTYHYDYDIVGRLWRVTTNNTLTATYAYDPNGNRTSGPGFFGTPDYDAQDRLLFDGSATYMYTANGELSAKTDANGETRYNYDVFGNLRSVELPDSSLVEYVIDGMDRRVARKYAGVATYGLLYQDPLRPVASLDSAGHITWRAVYALGRNVPEYLVRGGVQYRMLTDHLGSVRLIVNVDTGEITERRLHDAWGKQLVGPNSDESVFGYAGGLYDSHTTMTRFGVRDYDARIGRWTAKDTQQLEGEAIEPYRYAANDPVTLSDSTGFTPEQVQNAFKNVKDLLSSAAPELKIPDGVDLVDLPPGVAGNTPLIGNKLQLSKKLFDPELSSQNKGWDTSLNRQTSTAEFMLQTMLHELLHYNESQLESLTGLLRDALGNNHNPEYNTKAQKLLDKALQELKRRRKRCH